MLYRPLSESPKWPRGKTCSLLFAWDQEIKYRATHLWEYLNFQSESWQPISVDPVIPQSSIPLSRVIFSFDLPSVSVFPDYRRDPTESFLSCICMCFNLPQNEFLFTARPRSRLRFSNPYQIKEFQECESASYQLSRKVQKRNGLTEYSQVTECERICQRIANA